MALVEVWLKRRGWKMYQKGKKGRRRRRKMEMVGVECGCFAHLLRGQKTQKKVERGKRGIW